MIIVGVALAVALAAALVTWRYLDTADARASKDQELVDVFLVKKDIAKGLPGDQVIDQGYIAKDQMPKRLFPANAVLDAQSLRGRIASINLKAGATVVEDAFVDPRTSGSSVAGSIAPGMQAISVNIDRVHGVGGFIQPGDRVNLLLTEGGVTRFALQKVKVLLVGPAFELDITTQSTLSGQVAQAPDAGLITFEVPAIDAIKIAHATQAGGIIYLALVREDYQPVTNPKISTSDLY